MKRHVANSWQGTLYSARDCLLEEMKNRSKRILVLRSERKDITSLATVKLVLTLLGWLDIPAAERYTDTFKIATNQPL